MAQDQPTQVDDIISNITKDFSGGQNAALNPQDIAENQFALGINVSTQKKTLTPRWALVEKDLDFTNTGNYTRLTGLQIPFEDIFYSGKFQAFIPYTIGPDFYNIYVVSGFIYLINLLDFMVVVLNPTDSLNVYADRVNWSSAGKYLVIFDYPNYPFIIEGIQTTRSDPTKLEIPISVLGTYNQNRLCIANAGIDWTAGDPSGSLAAPKAPITFLEVLTPGSPYYLNVYQIPTATRIVKNITAMGFLQVLDTSMGIGPLLIGTSDAIYSYRTDLPRSQWQGGANNEGFVFGSVILYSNGIAGQRAFVNVGGDVLFRSPDGHIHSMTMARDQLARWSNSPISKEVNNFLNNNTELNFVSISSYYNNKIFFTCNTHRVSVTSADGLPQIDYVSSGVVVIELDNTSTLRDKSLPSWAGVWTGVDFMDMAENNEILWIAGKRDGKNKLFKFDPEGSFDIIGGKQRPIRSVIETREYVSKDQTVTKRIHSLDLGLREIEEKVVVDIEYRPSTTETYYPWTSIVYNSPYMQCDFFPTYPEGLQRQGILNLNTGGIAEVCDEASGILTEYHKGVQVRLIITGSQWELDYIKLKTKFLAQSQVDPYCEEKPGVAIPADCFDIWYIPSIDCKE